MQKVALRPTLPTLAQVAELATAHAAGITFADYRARKSPRTLNRQDDDLAAFADYLATVKVARAAKQLASDPETWRGVNWALIKGFVGYLLKLGYSVSAINPRLSTIRTYCGLAAQSGAIDAGELAMIKTVRGYSRQEGRRVDAHRSKARISTEKTQANVLTDQQADQLRSQPDTLHGQRDAVMIGLMLDLGLRVSEVAALTINSIDPSAGTITFYREKVDKQQTHQLPPALLQLLTVYMPNLSGPLVPELKRGGDLTTKAATRFGMAKRLRTLGREIGISNLGPHDLRHTWATRAARNGTPLDKLKEAGGWNSISMPATRYIQAARIANQGVLLKEANK